MEQQEVKDPVTARKVQKADREKLRRDRLNEQYMELGNALDPDRPRHDKATILTDTIQMLKDLTAHVDRMKAEYTSLSEESRELTQEKNELREEKATIKSHIDNLNAQYQQRLRVMFPWAPMGPATYPYPMPMPIPSGPIAMHPSVQPFPIYRNQNPGGAVPNPCPTFLPYPACNHQTEQMSAQCISTPHLLQNSRSQTASRQESRSRSSDCPPQSTTEKEDDFSDVVTELELKTPGSSRPSSRVESTHDKELSSEGRREKQRSPPRKNNATDESCSSRCSSSSDLPDSFSRNVGDPSVADWDI
ncbi:Transcription factor [Acorus gramineus]|uniref:Transcription factor n=1 Tax=Acorus gramineus TaxID=55184 RepID=A0AAV9AAY9_ACOGR|nr:Transcription factor [Acorus gramineus]